MLFPRDAQPGELGVLAPSKKAVYTTTHSRAPVGKCAKSDFSFFFLRGGSILVRPRELSPLLATDACNPCSIKLIDKANLT